MALILVLAMPAGVHLSLTSGRWRVGAIGFVLAEAVLVSCVLLRGWARVCGFASVGAVAVALAARLIPLQAGLVGVTEASHDALYGTLLGIFACSLCNGNEAIVTCFARRARGSLSPDILAYTRWVTWAWCMFFAGQIVVSTTLLVFAPRAIWSLFVNVFDFPLVLAMFLAEYACRRLVFRHLPHAGMVASVRAAVAWRAS